MTFDRDYYQRFYFNPRTAVTSRAEMRARAGLVAACVGYLGLPVGKILDAGCGVGLLRAPLLRHFKRADYTGLEFSDYLCGRYGWHQGSVESFRSRKRFDLVICYDVLQYLSEPQARRAIANLGRLCRGALYFGALTREDWRDNWDRTRTHRIPGLRPGGWYRRELSRLFRPMGCGMWIKRDLPLTLWTLDACAS
jgi:2-polyprenyl-3-methyl-5-hydroxy-6-metoxy-1,4-benzoquinol methylase